MDRVDFEILKGKILKEIIKKPLIEDSDDYIIFVVSDDEKYKMYHDQCCCESVWIDDICGNLDNLIDTEILVSEERTNHIEDEKEDESITWSFYEIATIKGSVTITWKGTSNGYYSESVDFERI